MLYRGRDKKRHRNRKEARHELLLCPDSIYRAAVRSKFAAVYGCCLRMFSVGCCKEHHNSRPAALRCLGRKGKDNHENRSNRR